MPFHQDDGEHASGAITDESLLARAAQSLPEAMLTLDGAGRVTSANRAACGLLGWPQRELVGRSAHAIAHGDDAGHGEAECPLNAIPRSGEAGSDDVFVHRGGARFEVAYSAAALVPERAPTGAVLMFRDVTEGKRRRRHELQELKEFAWVLRIREALERGRFELHEQPVVELRHGDIARHELLLRLADDGEAASPQDFLAIAERYGLVAEIDRWVTAEAVRLTASGRKVSVNLSVKSISPEFVDFAERELTAAGADPGLLVFELSESQLLEDEDAGFAFVRGLHRIGCGFALDDFGSEYGGFSYLKDLPVDYIKIDVEFVRGLSHRPANRHVVEAIVKLAEGYGQSTVAEGVEDLATLQILDEVGVDFAQGFALGRPAAPVAKAA
jgi:PAS domain S-box-containing protein